MTAGGRVYASTGRDAILESDGTIAGTHVVATGISGAQPIEAVEHDGVVYLRLYGSNAAWRFDGTAAGARRVVEGPLATNLPWDDKSAPWGAAAHGVVVGTSDYPWTLSVTDGTAAGTTKLVGDGVVTVLGADEGRVWFVHSVITPVEAKQWVGFTDGTLAGTHETPVPFSLLPGHRYVPRLKSVFFVTQDGHFGRSDGTAAGTTLVDVPSALTPGKLQLAWSFGNILKLSGNHADGSQFFVWSDGKSFSTPPDSLARNMICTLVPDDDVIFARGAPTLWRMSGGAMVAHPLEGELLDTSSCPTVTTLARNGTQKILRASWTFGRSQILIHDMATHHTTVLEYPVPVNAGFRSWQFNGTVLGDRFFWTRGAKLFATPLSELLLPLPR